MARARAQTEWGQHAQHVHGVSITGFVHDVRLLAQETITGCRRSLTGDRFFEAILCFTHIAAAGSRGYGTAQVTQRSICEGFACHISYQILFPIDLDSEKASGLQCDVATTSRLKNGLRLRTAKDLRPEIHQPE